MDKLDKKILCCLDENSRQSFSQIAKQVKTSKEVVRYRFEQLIDKKILQNCNALVNTYKLGYLIHIIWIKFQNTTKEIEREIIEKITKSQRVGVALEIYGSWDFVFGIWAKNTVEFKKYFDNITNEFSQYFGDYSVTIEINSTYLSQNFLYDGEIPSVLIGNELTQQSLDDIDIQIIKQLALDARKPIVKLAINTGLKANAVAARIKQLEKKGIIAGYKTTINYEELGLMHYRVFLKVNKSDVKQIMNYLKSRKLVISVMNYIGLGDVEFRLCVKSVKELNEELSELKRQFVLQDYDSILFLKNFEVLNFLPI